MARLDRTQELPNEPPPEQIELVRPHFCGGVTNRSAGFRMRILAWRGGIRKIRLERAKRLDLRWQALTGKPMLNSLVLPSRIVAVYPRAAPLRASPENPPKLSCCRLDSRFEDRCLEHHFAEAEDQGSWMVAGGARNSHKARRTAEKRWRLSFPWLWMADRDIAPTSKPELWLILNLDSRRCSCSKWRTIADMTGNMPTRSDSDWILLGHLASGAPHWLRLGPPIPGGAVRVGYVHVWW